MNKIHQETLKEDIDQKMALLITESIGSKNPAEIVGELFSKEGIEKLKKQIVIPDVFFIEKSGYGSMPEGLDGNFFNSMHKLATQQVILSGKFGELTRVKQSPTYGIYVRARDKVKGVLGFDIEKYDEQKILDRQLTNLEICNESVGALVAYSREELSVLRDKGVYRIFEMGSGQKAIDQQKRQVELRRQTLVEARKQIPEKPWGEDEMIRIALAEKLGHKYEDGVDRLRVYESALKEIAKDKRFVNAIERMLRGSTVYLEQLLVTGISTARSIREIKPSLEIMKNQGLVSRLQEKQIIDIGNSSLELYNQSGLSCREIYRMVQHPAIEKYISSMSGGSLGEFITQERGIDLDNLDYLSRLGN